jgi:2-polyprenyl-6-methoxyphenol hydroxylase-like FAD-dependent oxidoreductase
LIKEYGGGDIRWPMMPKLLEAVRQAQREHFHFSEAVQIRMPEWSNGRVVLIGDAAACPSPLTGQGGSFAVLSGYILARELFKAQGDHRVAFPAYQQALYKFVQKNQELADINVDLIKDSKSLKARVIRWCMNHIPISLIFYIQRWLSSRIEQAANAVELGENFLPKK